VCSSILGAVPISRRPNASEWGDKTTNRPTEYNALDDKYAPRDCGRTSACALQGIQTFPKDPEHHGIGGSSSGRDCRVHRLRGNVPNEFRKVLSNVGSFVDLRGGNCLPRYRPQERERNRFACFFSAMGGTTSANALGETYSESRDWFYQNVRIMPGANRTGLTT